MDEMYVEISGEGDFSVKTDSAWQIAIDFKGVHYQIDASSDGLNIVSWRWNQILKKVVAQTKYVGVPIRS